MTLTEFKAWAYPCAPILLGTKIENRQILIKLIKFTQSREIDIRTDDGYVYIFYNRDEIREKLTEEFLSDAQPLYVFLPNYEVDMWEELIPTPNLITLVQRTIKL